MKKVKIFRKYSKTAYDWIEKKTFLALFRTTLVLIADINTGTTKIFRSQWWINEFLNHERGSSF